MPSLVDLEDNINEQELQRFPPLTDTNINKTNNNNNIDTTLTGDIESTSDYSQELKRLQKSQAELQMLTNGDSSREIGADTEHVLCGDRLPENCRETELPVVNDVTTKSVQIDGKTPDSVAEADSVWTVARDQAVRLRMSKTGPASEAPLSIVTAFKNTVQQYPQHVAMARKEGGVWKKWTYTEYYSDVWRAAKALVRLGLEPYHGVGIIGFNSPEWFISNFAAIFAGGLSTGIYTTNSPEACLYVARSAKCQIMVVENDLQLQKILTIRSELKDLKAIVQYQGKPKEKYPNVYTWEEFMKLGEEDEEEEEGRRSEWDVVLRQRIQQQSVNKCCSLIYTSGTTGNSKGVMLSHDNLTWTARMASESAGFQKGSEILVSFLPLSHIAAQIVDMYIVMMYGGAIYFAQPDALRGSLAHTLREVRPTSFFGVPRVWEKIQAKISSTFNEQGWMKRALLSWALGVGLRGNLSRMNGGNVPYGWRLSNLLVFHKLQKALGFDRCRLMFVTGAPVTKETLEFFLGLNIQILDIYGMSETTGPHTISTVDRSLLTSAGPVLNGSNIIIDREAYCSSNAATTAAEHSSSSATVDSSSGGSRTAADSDDLECGEVCMEGRNVFMGYLGETDKTVEVIDSQGRLHSGDIGRLDKNGFLFITGRIKELLITAGGENVAPVPIEEAVKEALPCVSNCMLIGDKKKFLAILLTLKVEIEPETATPLDLLAPAAIDWCRTLSSDVTTISQLRKLPPTDPVMKAIEKGLNEANKKAISRAQYIQKFSILERDFSIVGGELGPTLKLRRPIVTKMYASTIDSFYASVD